MDFMLEKKMLRLGKILILLLIPFITNCNMKNIQDNNEDYEVYADEIVKNFAKEMKNEYGLLCIGSGGSMPHDVANIGVMFTIQKKMTSLEEARELEIAAIQKLLNHINNHQKIRPYLREYPFKYDRVRISISFTNENNEQYTDGSITYMYQARNKIFYKKAESCIAEGYQITDPDTNEVYTVPDKEDYKLIPYYDEPYEEALKKVKSLPKN